MGSSLPSYSIPPKCWHALQSRDEGQQRVIRLACGAPRYPARGCDQALWSVASPAPEVSLFCLLVLQHFWCHLGLFPSGPLVRAAGVGDVPPCMHETCCAGSPRRHSRMAYHCYTTMGKGLRGFLLILYGKMLFVSVIERMALESMTLSLCCRWIMFHLFQSIQELTRKTNVIAQSAKCL